jgi:hypothetical protein
MVRGVFPFGKFDGDKEIKSFTIDGAVEKNAGNLFVLRIGTSYQQMNPNSDLVGCGVLWMPLTPRPVKCLYSDSITTYLGNNIRPGYDHQFNYELSITGGGGKPPVDGGVMFSRFEVKAIQV